MPFVLYLSRSSGGTWSSITSRSTWSAASTRHLERWPSLLESITATTCLAWAAKSRITPVSSMRKSV